MARAALSLVLTLVWVMPVIAAEPSHPGRGQGGVLGDFDHGQRRSTPARSRKYVRGRYPSMKVDFCQPRLGRGQHIDGQEDGARPPFPSTPTLVVHRPGHERRRLQALRRPTGDAYIAGMTQLVDLIRTKTSARIILITPRLEPGVRTDDQAKKLDAFYPQTIRKISDRLVAFAKEKAIPVVTSTPRMRRRSPKSRPGSPPSSSRAIRSIPMRSARRSWPSSS